MAENTVLAKSRDGTKDIEIYTHDVLAAFDEYVQNLDDEDKMYKPPFFNGAMKYIQVHCFKPTKKMPHNAGTTVDLSDVDLLNGLWDICAQLAYRYGHKPSLHRFALMIGIDLDTISNWGSGGSRASSAHLRTVKKWKSETENALYDGASESNSVGSIFLLKSNFGYRETAPIAEPATESRTPQLSQAELLSIINERAALDALPDPDEGGEDDG